MNSANEWVLKFSSPLMPDPVQVILTEAVVIGRNDGKSDYKADVDLSAFDAMKKGVSRHHIRLLIEHDRLIAVDLGAANGTTLNGQRLQPERHYPLTGSDQLILGAFRLNVDVLTKPDTAQLMDELAEELAEKDEESTDEAKAQTGKLEDKRDLVLIVEDHVEVAELFAMILSKRGYETKTYRDAARAMRFLQKHHPAAILLDLMLPGMNGIEVCRYVRRDASLDQTAIIIVSANRNPGTERAAYDAGADTFIAKPVNPNELGDTVAQYIEKRKRGEEVTHELSDRDVTKSLDESEAINMNLPGISKDTLAVVVAGYTDRPFTVTVSKPMTFGRGAYANPSTHVDLSRFGAKDKGVSRIHMRVHHDESGFHLQDMDSMNGTFVNGERLEANHPVDLRSGQEVRLGQLAMTFYFVTDN